MSRRAVVLGLAAVIVVAVAIPALADSGPTAKPASVKSLSVRALGKAKAALRTARAAKRSARRAANEVGEANDSAQAAKDAAAAASGSAAAAQAAANGAKGDAAQAFEKATSAREVAGGAQFNSEQTQKTVAATRAVIGFAEGSASTESESFVELAGKPAVTVNVLTSGLVQVWGSALIDVEGSDEGAVSLYEDGHPAKGQANCFGVDNVLFSGAALTPGEPELFGTPAAFNPISGGCGTSGAPGPVLVLSSAGEHTFEFRYAACACGSPPAEKVTFSQRRLVVAPLP